MITLLKVFCPLRSLTYTIVFLSPVIFTEDEAWLLQIKRLSKVLQTLGQSSAQSSPAIKSSPDVKVPTFSSL